MLYQKTKEQSLEEALFKNPTSEYRGMPFWAWNTGLDLQELKEQIDVFKEMGFGGFHMHVRQGLETEYLGSEFIAALKGCTQKAKEEHLLFLGFFDGMTATMNSADVRRAYGGLACARMTKRTDYPDASGSSESRHFDQQKREMHRISLLYWYE